MKFTCARSRLAEALSYVTKAVAGKSALPVLEGVLLKTYEDTVYLCGYNLEMAITTEIPAKIIDQGEYVLNARLFSDMVRKMQDDTITIETNSKLMTSIKGQVTEFQILAMPTDEYPEIPTSDGELSARIDALTFKDMVSQTIFSAATTEFKPVYMGVLFEIEEKRLRMVAVDGYRLAIREEPIGDFPEKTFIVPSATLGEMVRLIKDEEGYVDITLSHKNISFATSGFEIVSRLLEGEFLNYREVIETGHTSAVTLDKKELYQAVERASLIINERARSPITLEFFKDHVKISSTTAIGKVQDEIPCKNEGEETQIGFMDRYLLEALRACTDETVTILLNGGLAPMRIVPLEEEDFLFLILPVRLKDKQ